MREKDWRAASQAFERMHNTLSGTRHSMRINDSKYALERSRDVQSQRCKYTLPVYQQKHLIVHQQEG